MSSRRRPSKSPAPATSVSPKRYRWEKKIASGWGKLTLSKKREKPDLAVVWDIIAVGEREKVVLRAAGGGQSQRSLGREALDKTPRGPHR